MQNYFVYIVCSRRNGTLYIGVTNNLKRRVYEHKQKMVAGFSKQYGTDKLVWAEQFSTISDALQAEKRLKHWKREWKLYLIEQRNPEWNDLYETID